MDFYKITLIDGSELLCPLKKEQPREIHPDNMKLDTTGEYLTIGTRKPKLLSVSMEIHVLRQYNHHLFTDNAWFLLEKADKILKDPKMFLAPIKVQNGLAYTGTSGFQRPTLGVYLEWWLHHKDASIDGKGNLIWFISGSPLSGSNCCYSVTPEGEQVKIDQKCSFSKIWSSFVEVNNRYDEAKQRCVAYSLEEVLLLLHGEDYKYRFIDLHHEMIEKVMEREKRAAENKYHYVLGRMAKLLKENRSIQLRQNREKIMTFYAEYSSRQEEVMRLEEIYAQKHRELKIQLREGTLEGDYKLLLANCSREFKEKRRNQSESLNKFIRDTFGKNPNNITPSDVLRYATGKPLAPPPVP